MMLMLVSVYQCTPCVGRGCARAWNGFGPWLGDMTHSSCPPK